MPSKGWFKDRTGEVNYNNFGSKMIIIKCKGRNDVNILFPKYNYIAYCKTYKNFSKGAVLCPYEPRYYGVGYLGEGNFPTYIDKKITVAFSKWLSMLKRCYNKKYLIKEPAYKDCKVCDEFLCFQNYAKWFYENYYEIEREKMELDKDILIKGNKIYSPETCVFIPSSINKSFETNKKRRGKCPIGVYETKDNKYASSYKGKHLGRYQTKEEAFQVYKQFKEKGIKEVADKYKDKIPNKLYEALYKYEVEITD